MSGWARHAAAIEAVAAAVTAAVAVAALVGVKLQLDANDTVQREQSARDAFRAHLVLAVEQPMFARPTDACVLIASDSGGGYAAFVDHLLYSAEQMLEVEVGWDKSFEALLRPHTDYLCSAEAPAGDTAATRDLLAGFRDAHCPVSPTC
ncbi:MAG: hypothetical protein AAF460_16480 [Pseudomonadota bacterium]